jgi:hypothetical protein
VDEERYIRWTFIEKFAVPVLALQNPCRVGSRGRDRVQFWREGTRERETQGGGTETKRGRERRAE